MSAVLPAPLGPMRPTRSSVADAEGDVLQDGLDAVGFVDVMCGKHGDLYVKNKNRGQASADNASMVLT